MASRRLTTSGTLLLLGLVAAGGAWAQTPVSPQSNAASKSAPAPSKDIAAALAAYEDGVAAFKSGQHELAITKLTVAIDSKALKQTKAAHALYYRGLTYRATKQPQLAITDLTNALLRKSGLNAAEQADALSERTEAYREAGLSDQQQPDPSSRTAQPSSLPASTPVSPIATSALTPPPKSPAPALGLQENPGESQPSFGDGLQNFFASIFGGTNAAPDAQTDVATVDSSAGGGSGTPSQGPTKVAGKPPSQLTSAPAALSGPSWMLQLAARRGQDQAQSDVAKAQSSHGELAQTANAVESVTFGAMGTFWRARIGPLWDAHVAQTVCAKLRGEGIDCMVVQK